MGRKRYLKSVAGTRGDAVRVEDDDGDDGLPLAVDWRNHDGHNFDSPIRNQGRCGSCYAFATGAMLEARTRIARYRHGLGMSNPAYSTSDVLSCSRYNEGCHGGYPFLVAKYAQEFGLVSHARHSPCAPGLNTDLWAQLHDDDDDDDAGDDDQCASTGRVRFTDDYHYVGGAVVAADGGRATHHPMADGAAAQGGTAPATSATCAGSWRCTGRSRRRCRYRTTSPCTRAGSSPPVPTAPAPRTRTATSTATTPS